MSAQFALKLSREGIGLYRREGEVWALAGQAALDGPDLAGALEALRAQAAGGGDGPVETHLILPNSEIRYTEVALGGLAGNAGADAIRSAIDGLTPYGVGELEIDWVRTGETARVAVIARETLREAEQFARAQGFTPVSRGAVPPPGAFPRDVDFGPAGGASAADDAAAQAQAPAPEEPAGEVAGDAAPAEAEEAPTPAPEGPPETLADWELDAPLAEAAPEAGPGDDVVAAPSATGLPDGRIPDAADGAPAPEPAMPDADEDPGARLGDEAGPGASLPSFSSRRARFQALPGAEPGPPERDAPPAASAPEAGGGIGEEPPVGEEAGLPDSASGAPGAQKAAPASTDKEPQPEAEPDPAGPAGKRGGTKAAKRTGRSRRKAGGGGARRAGTAQAARSEPAAERAPTVITTPTPARPATEAEALTVFGARRSGRPLAPGRAGPARLPFAAMLAVLLLAGLGVAALWLLPGRLPDLAGLRPGWPGGSAEQAAALPDGAPETSGEAGNGTPSAAGPVPGRGTGEGVQGGVVIDPNGSEAPAAGLPGETAGAADGAGAGAEVAAAAPQSPAAPREGAVGGLFLASIDPEVARPPAPWRPEPEQLKSDTRPVRPMPPPPPGQRFELDARGLVTPGPGEGTLSPEGVRVVAGAPGVTPPPRPAAVTRATRSGTGALTVAPVPPRRPVAPPPEASADQGTAGPAADRDAELLAAVPDVLLSVTPAARPAEVPAAVRASLEAAEEQRVAAPIPTSASVATRATVNDGLELGRLSLIGVFGAEGDRRALVRLDSGEFVEVSVGDRLDGGRVVAIGQEALRYVRGGRNVQLKLPEEG